MASVVHRCCRSCNASPESAQELVLARAPMVCRVLRCHTNPGRRPQESTAVRTQPSAWTQPTAPRRERDHFTPKKRPFVRYARKVGVGKHVTLNNVGRPKMEMRTQKALAAAACSQVGRLGLGRSGFGA
jgi:hypothetical protein